MYCNVAVNCLQPLFWYHGKVLVLLSSSIVSGSWKWTIDIEGYDYPDDPSRIFALHH